LTRKIARRKGFLFLTAILVLNVLLSFSATERTIRQGSVEVILGSYSMNEPRFDAVYKKGGLMVGVGLSAALASNVNFYLEVKYYNRTGELTFSKEKTDFYLLPISLGLRYIFPLGLLGRLDPYAGAGVDFYFYSEDNPIGTVLNYTNGYHLMGGTYVRFFKNVPLMLNLKLKYTAATAQEKDVKLQLGGFEYAAALVFAF
jgi:opacity protein-like surface antigen